MQGDNVLVCGIYIMWCQISLFLLCIRKEINPVTLCLSEITKYTLSPRQKLISCQCILSMYFYHWTKIYNWRVSKINWIIISFGCRLKSSIISFLNLPKIGPVFFWSQSKRVPVMLHILVRLLFTDLLSWELYFAVLAVCWM